MTTNKVTLERSIFRPSMLDKLAECSWFRSEPIPGAAAARGNVLDELLRVHYTGEKIEVPPQEREPFEYAIRVTDQIAGNRWIETRKEFCKVEIPRFQQPGECDAVIASSFTSIDWKSGHLRSYKLQQAAYALGQMLTNWAPRWSAAVVFYDEEQVVWERFELAEAWALIDQAQEHYNMPGAPTINRYCAWCANFETCPAQREAAGYGLAVAERAINFADILEDPVKLGKFLTGCHSLGQYEKLGRARAREYFFQKTEVPGFALSNGKRTHNLPVETLVWLLSSQKDWPQAIRAALEVHGPMTKQKYEELCFKLKIEPDKSLLKMSQGEPYIRAK